MIVWNVVPHNSKLWWKECINLFYITVSTKNDCILDGPRSVLPDMGRRYAKELDTELYETSCSTTLCTHDIIDQVNKTNVLHYISS